MLIVKGHTSTQKMYYRLLERETKLEKIEKGLKDKYLSIIDHDKTLSKAYDVL